MQRRTLLAASVTLLLSSAAWAQNTVEIAGVRYPPTMPLGGNVLQLNGAGIRYKFVIKVYTAGLYLGGKAGTTDAVLAAPGSKRMHVVMLRDIDANELGRLFTRGLEDNAPKGEFSKFIPGTIKLADIFSQQKKLKAGDAFDLDFVPGVGTTVLVNGKPTADPIKEPEFFGALLRIWLGPHPADSQLKDALLGKETRPSGGSNLQQ